MMRICSVTDLGLLSPLTKRLSRSTTRASSFPMVSFRPETISSVIGAMMTERESGDLGKGWESWEVEVSKSREVVRRRGNGEMEERKGLAPEVRRLGFLWEVY